MFRSHSHPQTDDKPESTIEPRFGDTAISKGFITIDQLVEALTRQIKEDENAKMGEHRLIGEILVDLGYMKPHQVRNTIEIMQAS